MATSKHLELSTYIKNVHKKLREDTKIMGYEKAWSKHCDDKNTLKKYASAMHELASTHWKESQEKPDSKALSRINWIHKNCIEYFRNGGLEYQRKRELDIAQRLEATEESKPVEYTTKICSEDTKFQLLDVGSCYNPFKVFDIFSVLPIDISPANDEVFQCDFLAVKIGDKTIENKQKILQLKSNSFHVIIFSLLLEYLPNPKQRLQCVENAYNLLKPEGILIIITPDAKHVGANAKYMKSWRYVLAKLGFCRIKYEKLTYIHCMVFRKSIDANVAKRWADLNKDKKLYEEIFIPQDFNGSKDCDS